MELEGNISFSEIVHQETLTPLHSQLKNRCWCFSAPWSELRSVRFFLSKACSLNPTLIDSCYVFYPLLLFVKKWCMAISYFVVAFHFRSSAWYFYRECKAPVVL